MASRKRRRKRRRRNPSAAPRQPVADQPARSRPNAKRRAGFLDAAEERPPAPWGSFPLVELAILIGLVMLVLGLFAVGGDRGTLLIGVGLGLAGLGGLELAIREHFAGFRSHSALLGGVPGVAAIALLAYAGPDSLAPLAVVGIGVALWVAAALGLAAMFRRKAGVAVKLR